MKAAMKDHFPFASMFHLFTVPFKTTLHNGGKGDGKRSSYSISQTGFGCKQAHAAFTIGLQRGIIPLTYKYSEPVILRSSPGCAQQRMHTDISEDHVNSPIGRESKIYIRLTSSAYSSQTASQEKR